MAAMAAAGIALSSSLSNQAVLNGVTHDVQHKQVSSSVKHLAAAFPLRRRSAGFSSSGKRAPAGVVCQAAAASSVNVKNWTWQLAKAYVVEMDTHVHQAYSHFTCTHATCEAYLIALRRQLSGAHPLLRLLLPHFRYTLAINAAAREQLINAGGIIEQTFAAGKYALPLSAELYKGWRFSDQALPQDLENRGLTLPDELVNELDLKKRAESGGVLPYYPYRDFGLIIWKCIEEYVQDYVSIYYSSDEDVMGDEELLNFWTEVKDVAHGEADPSGWPPLTSTQDLVRILTTMIWSGSGLHSAINFGQYDYASFPGVQPTTLHAAMPEMGDKNEDDDDVVVDEEFYTAALPNVIDAGRVAATVELLATHSPDEQYLGFSSVYLDANGKKVFAKFAKAIMRAEKKIRSMNSYWSDNDKRLMPYVYLTPRYYAGNDVVLGIPNSVSI